MRELRELLPTDAMLAIDKRTELQRWRMRSSTRCACSSSSRSTLASSTNSWAPPTHPTVHHPALIHLIFLRNSGEHLSVFSPSSRLRR